MGDSMTPNEIRRAFNDQQFNLLVQKGTRSSLRCRVGRMVEANRLDRCLGLEWNEALFPVSVWKTHKNPTRRPNPNPPVIPTNEESNGYCRWVK